MDFLHLYFREYTLAVPFFALFIAIILKGVFYSMQGRFEISRALGSGGMPSAHSTLVIALSTAMGMKYGIWSDIFLVSLSFSVVIIYDALNVRYQSGIHARILNQLGHREKILNESMGHTPLEALAGGIVGFSTAVILLGI